MADGSRLRTWLTRIGAALGAVVLAVVIGMAVVSRADGPLWVFHGGPFQSGEPVAFASLDWSALDELHELEMEIVGEESSLTLWFSVTNGVPYVGCDLDCVGGVLPRWPQQIALDDRVVLRIDGKLVSGRLEHVPHGTAEYQRMKADRDRKYAGEGSVGAATETAAHATVVNVGEVLTGRAGSEEPGDRMFRFEPVEPGA